LGTLKNANLGESGSFSSTFSRIFEDFVIETSNDDSLGTELRFIEEDFLLDVVTYDSFTGYSPYTVDELSCKCSSSNIPFVSSFSFSFFSD